MLKLNDELKQQAPGAALLKLQHNGAPGAIIATGFVLNSKNGYSATFVLSDPEASQSSILAGAHVTFGIPDPTLGFPGETRFRAPLILGNVSDQTISARVSVDYTIEAQPTSLGVSQLKLAPSEVKVIELTDELAHLGVTGPVRDAGVDVSYDGPPGSLIGHLTSVDQTGDLSFETPVKDPLELGRMPQNSYPWSLEDNAQTVVHLKNTTPQEVWAVVQFRYPGGTYNPDRIHLSPYQTLPLNVREMQKSEQKDVREKAFPKSATRGQVVWMEETPGSMIGRAELINLPAGVSRSFSCPGACQCPAQPGPGQCQPPGYTGPVGSEPQFTARFTTQDCQGTSFGPFNASGVTWSSGNSSIANVTTTGAAPNAVAHYASTGNTTVTGRFNQTGYGGQGCTQQFPVPSAAQCPVTVQNPDHLRVSSDTQATVNCGSNPSSLRRDITYNVVDVNDQQLFSLFLLKENVPTNLTSTCNGQTVQTGATCTLNILYLPNQLGKFTDFISPGCPSSSAVTPCGFTFPNQQWQWCRAVGSPTSIGTIGPVNAQNTLINVNGNVLGFTPGTTFPK